MGSRYNVKRPIKHLPLTVKNSSPDTVISSLFSKGVTQNTTLAQLVFELVLAPALHASHTKKRVRA